MSKIGDKTGRVSLEEFGIETTQEDASRATQPAASPAAEAAEAYPRENERTSPAPLPLPPTENAAIPEPGLGGVPLDAVAEEHCAICDPQPPEPPPPIVCPTCVPNPYAYVPHYQMMEDGESFFNGKLCTQNIVFVFDSPSEGGPSVTQLEEPSFQEEQRMIGIRMLLEYFNKSDVITVFTYEPQELALEQYNLPSSTAQAPPPIGEVLGTTWPPKLLPEEKQALMPPDVTGYDIMYEVQDVVSDLLEQVKFEYKIPIQKKARTRVRISISTEYLDRIPEKLIPDSARAEEEVSTDLEVTFEGKEFIPTLKRLSRAFKAYNRELKRWRTFEGGRFVSVEGKQKTDRINLEEEAEKIKMFSNAIKSLISSDVIGLSFSPFKPAKNLEKITFKFEQKDKKKLELRQIRCNKFGCPDIVIGPKGKFKKQFKDLVKSPPFGHSRTLNYIGSAIEIDLALQSRVPTSWLSVVTNYTYPPIKVFYGKNSNSDLNEPRVAACFSKSPLENLGTNLAADVIDGVTDAFLSAPDAILQGLVNSSCHTREEVKLELGVDFMKELEGGLMNSLSRVLGEGSESGRLISIEDPYLEEMLKELVTSAVLSGQVAKTNRIFNQTFKDDPEYKKNSFRKAYRQVLKDEELNFWMRLVGPMGQCGFAELLLKAVDCLGQNLGIEASTGPLCKAALGAMDNNNIGNLFLHLPAIEQMAIVSNIKSKFGDIPPPWEAFSTSQMRSYTGPAFTMMEQNLALELDRYYNDPNYSGDITPERAAEIRLQLDLEVGESAVEALALRSDVGDAIGQARDQALRVVDDAAARVAGLQLGFEEAQMQLNLAIELGIPSLSLEDLEVLVADLREAAQNMRLEYEMALSAGAGALELEQMEAMLLEAEATAAAMALQLSISLNLGTPSLVLSELEGLLDDAEEALAVAQLALGEAEIAAREAIEAALGDVRLDGAGEITSIQTTLEIDPNMIAEIYKDAMLDAVGADVLIENMNKLPGAAIVAQLLRHSPCKLKPPVLDVDMDNFMATIGFDFERCAWDNDLTMPNLQVGLQFGGWFENISLKILMLARSMIISLAIAILMAILKLILDTILSIACDGIALTGANLMDLFDGNDHFRKLLKDNMCPEASMDDLHDSLNTILSSLGGPDNPCLENLSNAEMGDFIDDLSLMLTQGQMCQMLKGSPSEETMALALEVAATSKSECISEVFSDPMAFLSFFPALDVFIPNLDELCDALSPMSLSQPIHPCPPNIVGKIDDLKCKLLQQKGLSTEECREQLDDLKDQALQDLDDLLDALQNGPFSNLPALVAPDACAADGSDGLMSSVDPMVEDFSSNISEIIFDSIEQAHVQDLLGPINKFTGHGGVLNAVLSDTKGRPWKKHSWLVEHFGSPLAKDLGYFEWFSDNAIRPPHELAGKDKIPVDIHGNQLAAEEGKGVGISFFGYSDGGYPPTVGAHLQKQLLEMSPAFRTLNTPVGYNSMKEALDHYNEVQNINKIRIQRRKKYVEAWIDEFGLEDRGGKKRAAAADNLRLGIQQQIFMRGDPDKRPDHIKKNSATDLAREVLLGKQILGGVGNKGDPEGSWSRKNIKKANTNGKTFVDRWSRGNKYALLSVPDTSSADVRLIYYGYNEHADSDDPVAYEFSVEYDYNIFDEETSLLKRDNEYRVKIVETHRTPGTPSTADPENDPPKSLLDEGEVVYTAYDLVVSSVADDDIERIISNTGAKGAKNIPDSYEIEVLSRYISNVLVAAASKGKGGDPSQIKEYSAKIRDYFAEKLSDATFRLPNGAPVEIGMSRFDAYSRGFLKRVTHLVATGNSSEEPKSSGYDASEQSGKEEKIHKEIGLEGIAEAFKFGYDPYKDPKIVYLDPAKYGGARGKKDPGSIPPPFYVQERKAKGWMAVAQALVPEQDAFERARQPVYDLTDLGDVIGDLSNNLASDERLKYDPLCSTEAPFDKIMASEDAANIEAALRSMIRIYVLDAFIRGVPTFTAFGLNEKNYDSLLQTFVAERVRQGLYDDGASRTGKTDEQYYYRVLEQMVNNTSRMIDSGMIDPKVDLTREEFLAWDGISRNIKKFYSDYEGTLGSMSDAAIKGQGVFKRVFSTPAGSKASGLGSGSSRFSKAAAKGAKDSAFRRMIHDNEDLAFVFLKKYVREEFEVIRDRFDVSMPPLVANIHHLFLLNQDWIRGAAYSGGPFDVMSDPTDSSTYNIEQFEAASETSFSEEYWPFVLERYIKIEDKEIPLSEVADRKENLFGVVNIDDWQKYVSDKKLEGLQGNISDFWGNQEDQSGWKFGLRLSYMPPSKSGADSSFAAATKFISSEVQMREKAYRVAAPSQERYLIPIASAELPIPDEEFTNFDPEDYNVFCLIEELVNTPEYRTLFEYVFPLPRFTSLVAIYNVMSMFDSIGNCGAPAAGGDMWEVPGGRRGKGFRKWRRGPETFKYSRQAAKAVFTSFYEASQAIDMAPEEDSNATQGSASIREALRPKVNFEDGLRWWQRGRRIERRPFNADGEEEP